MSATALDDGGGGGGGGGGPYEYAVVGAGPAGLQMAYFLQKAGLRYVVLEARPAAASFFTRFPRHRRLISLNKRHNLFDEDEFNLRHDWNSLLGDEPRLRFPTYSDDLYPDADALVRYLNDYAAAHRLNIRYDCAVELVDKPSPDSHFILHLRGGGEVVARRLLMATGAAEEHLPQDIEGVELVETYSQHAVEKTAYNNKRVCILGGGNSAFETASKIVGNAAIVHMATGSELKCAWNTHYVGNLRAINSAIVEMARTRSMHGLLGSKVTKVERSSINEGCLVVHFLDKNTVCEPPTWYRFALEYDHVISCCGFKYLSLQLFSERARPAGLPGGRYPSLTSSWETSVSNLFFIGTASAGAERKKTSGGFIHGFRYNIRTLFNILMDRYHGVPLTTIKLGKDLEAVAAKIIERASISDGLYQMYSYLCDAIVIDDNGEAVYIPELPVSYVLERDEMSTKREHLFIFFLNYGFHRYNVEPIEDVHAPNLLQNECVPFLHTVVTYYHYGRKVCDCHLHGSLVLRLDKKSASMFPQWPHKASINYLMHFFNQQLKWESKEFDLETLPAGLLARIYTPLTESERLRIPAI